MKIFKLLTAITVVSLIGFALTRAFADDTTNTPPTQPGESNVDRPSPLEHLLATKALASLKLTADQKSLYDNLEASYKKDAALWNAANPVDPELYRRAKETGDKEAMRQLSERRQGLIDIRRGYIMKLRAALDPDQKEALDKVPFLNRHTWLSNQKAKPSPTPTPSPQE